MVCPVYFDVCMRIVKVISSGFDAFTGKYCLYAMVRVGIDEKRGVYSHEYRRFVFRDRSSLDDALRTGIVNE